MCKSIVKKSEVIPMALGLQKRGEDLWNRLRH